MSVRGIVRSLISIVRGLFMGIILKILDFPSQTLIFHPISDILKGITNLFPMGKAWNRDMVDMESHHATKIFKNLFLPHFLNILPHF